MAGHTTTAGRRWIGGAVAAVLVLGACGSSPQNARPLGMATATTATTLPAKRAAPSCHPSLASSIRSTEGAHQLITVEAPSYQSTYATVEWWQQSGSCWTLAGRSPHGRLGFDGFSDHHVEGQWSTPTGIYGIGPVMYGTAPNPGVRGAYHQLVCGDWWDEDPASAQYNTFQHVPCTQKPPFGGDSEALWTSSNAYPSFALIEYNTEPVVAGAGSAIFLHADIGKPTYGCVSLPRPVLDQLLRWLDPRYSPKVVMGPASEITRF